MAGNKVHHLLLLLLLLHQSLFLCLLLLTVCLLLLLERPMTGRPLVSIIIIMALGSLQPAAPVHCTASPEGVYLSPTTTGEEGEGASGGVYLGRGS